MYFVGCRVYRGSSEGFQNSWGFILGGPMSSILLAYKGGPVFWKAMSATWKQQTSRGLNPKP